MYNILLDSPTGRFVYSQVFAPQMEMRMRELSDLGRPALEALTDALPANLENRFKRLAGFLVKRAMVSNGYALVPGRRSRISASLFKSGALYRAVGRAHP